MQQQSRFRSLELSPEMVELERVLRKINVWHLAKVQKVYRRARLGTRRGSQQAILQLRQYIADYQASFVQNDNPYMPFATEEQITNNHQGVHIMNQAGNNIPLIIPQDELLLNTLVLGRPRGGKSSAVFYILQQLTVPVLILDPKNMWRHRVGEL